MDNQDLIITAAELRRSMKSRADEILRNILISIRAAAKQGLYSISYIMDGFSSVELGRDQRDVIQTLQKLGYFVTHDKNGDKWGTPAKLTVSWEA